jgi:predicted nucleotidyltransferase
MNEMILNELVGGLRLIYGDKLVSVILFGSVARGNETDESDIDIAIILKGVNSLKTRDKLVDFAVDLDLKYDKVFSIIDINYDEYIMWEEVLPFYKNVKRDGVVLWTAAY